MSTAINRKITYAAIAAMLAQPGSVYGSDISAVAPTELSNIQFSCNQQDYQSSGLDVGNCHSCKDTVKQLASDMNSVVKNASTKSAALNGQAQRKIGSSVAGAAAGQRGGAAAQNAGTGDASTGLANQANIAKGVSGSAQQCVDNINKVCKSLVQIDQDQADKAKKACEKTRTGADQVAAEKSSGSGDMGQLMQQAGQLAQMLGQMMQQQPEAATNPTTSGIGETQSSNLSAKNSGASVGFDTPVSSKNASNGKEASSGYNGYGRDFSAEASKIGASGFGSGISANAAGASGLQASTSSGGGGANSSGASMMGEIPESQNGAAAKNELTAGFEWGGGGGGGGGGYKSPMFGLKGKGSEAGSELGDLMGGDNKNAQAEEDGDRTLASADEMGSSEQDINDAGDTLFNVIHTKLSEVKRRGSI